MANVIVQEGAGSDQRAVAAGRPETAAKAEVVEVFDEGRVERGEECAAVAIVGDGGGTRHLGARQKYGDGRDNDVHPGTPKMLKKSGRSVMRADGSVHRLARRGKEARRWAA